MRNNYDLLRMAMKRRRPVIAFYEGYERHFCPHVLGTKQGEARVLGFQYAGGSSSGLPPAGEWRCMRVHGLTELAFQAGPWRAGIGHSGSQVCVDEVDLEIPF